MKETVLTKEVIFTREVYTKESELVDEVYYNENTRDLYVDLDTAIYRYASVPADVVDAFEKADSAGEFYNSRVKGKYLSVNLGTWLAVDYKEVDKEEKSAGFAAGGFVAGDGSAHFPNLISGNLSVNAPVNRAGLVTQQPSHFSLSPFKDNGVAKVEGVEREYKVTFEVDGLAGSRSHTLKSTGVDKAVDAVLELGSMLDLNFVVREVTIKFE